MSVESLAAAASRLSEVCRKESDLKDTLGKWVAKNLKPSVKLARLSELARTTGTLERLLEALTEPNLRKLAKGLDRYNSELDARKRAAILEHVVALVSGRVAPTPAPPTRARASGTRNREAKPVDPSAIHTMGSRSAREAALNTLSIPQLRSYINEENLRPAGVRPNAKKGELVHHILDELEVADSPLPRLLANSKYGARVTPR